MDFLPWIVCAASAAALLVLPKTTRRFSGLGKQPSDGSDEAANRGAGNSGVPKSPSDKLNLRERLVHAGFYRENFLPLLRVVRLVLLCLVVLAGYLLSLNESVTLKTGLTIGCLGAGFAGLMPGFVLDYLKRRRQVAMRRALPDALDVIVISLEGGLPVAASFRRVSSELAGVHPLLSLELLIVQREVQMGRSLGAAMHNLARRFDLDDLRNMATVIDQSERYGSGVTRAFRIFADGLRAKRIQQAEETARRASVKLVFPTVLFIFPVMFVVILAPAVFQLTTILRSFNANYTVP